MIERKVAVPPLAERVVARRRVSEELAALIDSHPVVWLCATAGAGKTTAMVHAIERLERSVAWFTVDDTDAAPGRLLTYLEAALGRRIPGVAGVAREALAARAPHAEVAGLLAEASAGEPLLLVVDELERLAGAEEALAVLDAFIRYAPPTLRIVLISRREVPLDLRHGAGADRVAAVGETDLAFTPAEAAEVLAGAGQDAIDPVCAVEVTGGWVTGVLFEAWRSADHIAGAGGEADPLHGYLASQILGQLEPDERAFLEDTALLDEVTVERAEALGQRGAGEMLVGLRAKHLPVSWLEGGRGMRCHTRFREYLLERLSRRGDPEMRAARRRYGELLIAEGLHEEATEQLIQVGELERALDAAELAIGGVVARLDFDVAERWLEALEPVATEQARQLTTAELMLAIGREDFRSGGRIADRLRDAGQREALAGASSLAASLMAWCYFHLGRIDDSRRVIEVAPPSPELEATRYMLRLVHYVYSPGERPFSPTLSGGPLDAVVMRVHYAHGRLSEVGREPTSSWAAAVTSPWRIGALRAMGHLDEALSLYRAAPRGEWAPAWLHGMVAAELMIDLGATDEALRELEVGREMIRASGSVVFEMLHRLIEAKLELRMRRDPEAAIAILDSLEADGTARRYDFIGEQIDTWRGMALLMASPEADATAPLERAVQQMLASQRILELPTAAVLLAEAHWRLGDEESADRAADRALEAARRQGSNHHLLQALADFPAVLARRLDAEESADSPWHDLGRALMAQGVPVGVEIATSVRLDEFGSIAAYVGEEEVRPRISKSYALLAYLATRPAHEAGREQLLGALFDGRSDESARAYLRQAAHRLREVLPDGVGPSFEGSTLRFDGRLALVSESARFEALLVEAGGLQEGDRLETVLEALAIFDAGEYLPGIDTEWASARRTELAALAADARLEAAKLAFRAGRYRQAEALAEAALADDPFKESGWRLVMRIANATGDEDRVIEAYERCRSALGTLGAAPARSTQQLLGQLRR